MTEQFKHLNNPAGSPLQTNYSHKFPVFGLIHDAMLLDGRPGRKDTNQKIRDAARRGFREQLHTDRRLLLQLMGISDISEIDQIRQDEVKIDHTRTHATKLIAGLYNIPQEDAAKSLFQYKMILK